MRILYSGIVLCLASACGPVEFREPIGGSDEISAPVTVRSVRSFNGGVTIYYDLPDDDNLKCVAAKYCPNGIDEKEVKSSIFVDSLTIKGFSTDREYDIAVYSVNRKEKYSSPQHVIVKPETPPYMVAYQTFKSSEIFGGIKITYDNPAATELEVSTIRKKETDVDWEQISQFNSASTYTEYSIRGLESERTEFGFIIKDRYENRADTIFATHTPYYEQEMDKSKFSPYPAERYYDNPHPNYGVPLPGDVWAQHKTQKNPTNGVHGLYDGTIGNNANAYFSPSTSGLPQGITIDLGRECKLSRIVLWPRKNGTSNYGHSFPKSIAFYGSNKPSPLGVTTENGVTVPDNSWSLLGDFICIPPSGATELAEVTELDKEFVEANGHTYEISTDAPSVRYLRLWTKGVWLTTNKFVCIAEIDVYGEYIE